MRYNETRKYIVTVPQKIVVSFLLSAFLFAGMAVLFLTGIFELNDQEIPVLVSVFLTLFLIIFFCFNVRQDSKDEMAAPHSVPELPQEVSSSEELEELEAVTEKKPIPVIVDDAHSGGTAVLEELSTGFGNYSFFKQHFVFTPDNPGLLPGCDDSQVIYEQNGIHFINSGIISDNNDADEKLDDHFAKLVQSVVGRNKY